jgi:hypothetical protein
MKGAEVVLGLAEGSKFATVNVTRPAAVVPLVQPRLVTPVASLKSSVSKVLHSNEEDSLIPEYAGKITWICPLE